MRCLALLKELAGGRATVRFAVNQNALHVVPSLEGAANSRLALHVDPNDMVRLMTNADIAIGAGFERFEQSRLFGIGQPRRATR